MECGVCAEKFTLKRNLKRHVQKQHGISWENILLKEQRSFNCQLCQKQFNYKHTLKEHVMSVHPADSETVLLECDHCGEKFRWRSCIRRHISKLHRGTDTEQKKKKQNQIEVGYAVCGKCSLIFKKRCSYIGHLKKKHDVQMQVHYFKYETEFFKWKNEIEAKHTAKFRLLRIYGKRNGIKKLYICNRVGHLKTKIQRRRMPRRKGSCRIGAQCPAQMLVTNYSERIRVNYIVTHWFHKKEMSHTSIRPEEKKKIYDQLELGVPVRNIVDNMRKSYSQELQRIHLIDRQDVYNVAQQQKLMSGCRLHDDDSTSVALWVKENENKPESPILLFKNKGMIHPLLKTDEFVLVLCTPIQRNILRKYSDKKICIDTTFNTNAYGFLLTTIMVTNEYEEGVPAAFCISNSVTQIVMKLFFNVIKEAVGILKPLIFMSDDDKTYYESWREEMGEVEKRLLCIWHVIRCWKKNAKKIPYKGLRDDILKQLRILQQESDQDSFSIMLTNFLEKISVNPRLANFQNYFATYYASRVEMWAQYNRMSTGINTNMFLESFHRHLKYIYLRGRANRRLDALIQALLKNVNDKIMEKNIADIRQKGRYRLHEIHRIHKKGQQIKKNTISWDDNTKSWKVNSYTVKQISNICKQCKLQCTTCKVCRHMFTCECYYYGHTNSLCKHIHAVCIHFTVKDINIQQHEEIESSTIELTTMLEKNKNVNHMSEIHEMAITIQNLSKESGITYTNNELETCKQHLRKAIEILMKTNNNNNNNKKTIPHVPHNKKIEPQNRWKRVKKEFKAVDIDTKVMESRIIKEQLLTPMADIIPIRHDHCYAKDRSEIKESNENNFDKVIISKPNQLMTQRSNGNKLDKNIIPKRNRFTIKETNRIKLNEVVISNNSDCIKEYHLRSLETRLTVEEVNQIKTLSNDFVPGWLYDCVINEYLRRLCQSVNKGYAVDSIYSQIISSRLQKSMVKEITNILNADIAFVPSNPTGQHWILIVIIPSKKHISKNRSR